MVLDDKTQRKPLCLNYHTISIIVCYVRICVHTYVCVSARYCLQCLVGATFYSNDTDSRPVAAKASESTPP